MDSPMPVFIETDAEREARMFAIESRLKERSKAFAEKLDREEAEAKVVADVIIPDDD
jgi:hypothetical protein